MNDSEWAYNWRRGKREEREDRRRFFRVVVLSNVGVVLLMLTLFGVALYKLGS